MTTLLNLPEEILLMIIQKLHRRDILPLLLCRDLTRPAHFVLLKEVQLHSSDAFSSFLAFFDHHAEPLYMNTVRKIDFRSLTIQFDNELFERLLYRFPNLTDISMKGRHDQFDETTEEVYKNLLKKCTKLDSFEAHLYCQSQGYYCSLIYEVRLLQTAIDLDFAKYTVAEYGGIQQFVRNFPRLNKIYGTSSDIDNFEKLLQTAQNAPNLRHIQLRGFEADRDNFAEDYFLTAGKNQQEAIKRTLSEITDLHLSYYEKLCVHAMKFVAENCTGLQCFSINNSFREIEWTQTEEMAFIYILNILASVKKNRKIDMYSMNLYFLAQQFPNIVHSLFHSVPSGVSGWEKTLRINMTERTYASMDAFPPDRAELHHTTQTRSKEQEIQIKASSQLSLYELVTTLFKATDRSTDYINNFVLNFPYKLRCEHKKPLDIGFYEIVMNALPLLQDMTLELPALVEETTTVFTNEYPRLKKLTLRGTSKTNIQALLNRCGTAFPNLRYLVIHNFSGVWNEDLAEFQITMRKSSLDKLTVDMTLVKAKIKDYDFFVLEVRFSRSKRQMFIISLDFKSVSSINDKDLESFFPNDDYVRVYITMKSLQTLELLIHLGDNPHEDYLEEIDMVRHVTIEYQNN